MKNEEEILNILTKRNVRLPQHCISILLSKEKERREEERERRTGMHGGDTGCIPPREITVERRGKGKRYYKRNKR